MSRRVANSLWGKKEKMREKKERKGGGFFGGSRERVFGEIPVTGGQGISGEFFFAVCL